MQKFKECNEKHTDLCIGLWDTSIGSNNLGDQIITDAVELWLSKIGILIAERLPTHSKVSLRDAIKTKYKKTWIIGGTNLLSSNWFNYHQWRIGYGSLTVIKPAILMGVGWWQYQSRPDLFTSTIWRKILSSTALHAVRDSYTADMLSNCGISNVVVTGCPSLWDISSIIKSSGPSNDGVVVTITDYNRNEERDKLWLKAVIDIYGSKLYFWPQGSRDIDYAVELFKSIKYKPKFLASRVFAFDKIMREKNIDYIGTRLHAGIRALQFLRRTHIIGIDNRAIEMAKDFRLPVVELEDIKEMQDLLREKQIVSIKNNSDEIKRWSKKILNQ